MNRRHFLAGLTGLPLLHAQDSGGSGSSLIMLTRREAESIRKSLPAGKASLLRELAAKELKAGPWSVTSHRPPNSKFDLHDYYSEGPYFWPNTKDPKGPSVRKDGERNPDRFDHNHHDIGALSTAVLTLGMATYFLQDASYAAHAGKLLSVWFLDAETRMNPHLEHGQAVPGVNDGRGTGLIDTVSLIHCAQGIMLLEAAGKLDPATASGLRKWYADFLHWMLTSAKGKSEGKSGNNHATWYTAQIAAYGTFTGDSATVKLAADRYRMYLVPEEIQPDGKCPREEARTNSLSYSIFNADAFATLCRIEQSSGVDLWDFVAPSGVSYAKVLRYVTPFVLDPSKWKGQQITPYKGADSVVYVGLASAGLRAPDLIAAYRKLGRARSAWVTLTDLIVSNSLG